jgi:predicted CoA-binding protein
MPKLTCAVIGARSDRSKYSNKALRAHQMAGYEVFPVSVRGGEIEGLQAFASVVDIPGDRPLDRVTMYVGPQVGVTLLDDIAQRGCKELFLNPGTASNDLIEKAEQLGLNVVEGCSIIDVGYSPYQLGE